MANYSGGKIAVNQEEHEDFKRVSLDDSENYNTVDYLRGCFQLIKSKRHKLFSNI